MCSIECWCVAASEKKRIARARLMRGSGRTTCHAVLLLVVVVEDRGVWTMLQIEGGRWSSRLRLGDNGVLLEGAVK